MSGAGWGLPSTPCLPDSPLARSLSRPRASAASSARTSPGRGSWCWPYQQNLLDAVPKLPYRSVTRDGDTVLFTLRDAAPDNLPWPENAPVAVMDANKPQAAFFVGHVMRINGNIIQVSRDAGDTHKLVQPAEQLPITGLLGIFQQEARVALERQRAALDIIRAGATVNPRLPDVLLDLSTRSLMSLIPASYFSSATWRRISCEQCDRRWLRATSFSCKGRLAPGKQQRWRRLSCRFQD